jgi:hypothetical protein
VGLSGPNAEVVGNSAIPLTILPLPSSPSSPFVPRRTHVTATAADSQEPAIKQGVSRSPGLLWDFSGTSGCINRHGRETAERPFTQVSSPEPPSWQVAGLAGLFRDI